MAFAESFKKVTTAPVSKYWYETAIAPDGTWYGMTFSGAYKSTDNAVTWTEIESGLVCDSICFSSDGAIVYITTESPQSIYKSTDYGATFTKIFAGTTGAFLGIACSGDGSLVIASNTANGKYKRSTNGGSSWSDISAPAGIGIGWLSCSSDGTKWIAGQNSFEKVPAISTDSGATWSAASTAVSGRYLSTCVSYNGSVMYAANWATGPSGGSTPDYIYKSTDNGATWAATSAPQANWFALGCSHDGTKLIAIQDVNIWVSSDSGATWSNNYVSSLYMDCQLKNAISPDTSNVFVGTYGTGAYPLRSIDFHINSITPNLGSTNGGTPVTIEGVGFDPAATAAIDGNNLNSVTVVDETTLTGITPAGTLGSKDVTVTNP